MIQRHHTIIILIIVLISPVVLSAKVEMPAKPEFAIYPQFSYSDETGFSGGPLAFVRFHFNGQTYNDPRSIIQTMAVYSEKKQFSLRLLSKLYFPGNIYNLETNLKYKYWPSSYYGIGNAIDPDVYEHYTPKEYNVDLDFNRKISAIHFTALLYRYSNLEIDKSEEDGILITETIPGSETYTVSGLGLRGGIDTRDLINYPSKGFYTSISSIIYDEFIGSDYNFVLNTIDLRTFFSIDEKQIIAGQILTNYINGTAPFNELSQLSDGLRTVSSDQYLDNLMLSTRLEYRVFPWEKKYIDRIGLVAFAGIGNVYNKIADISTENLNYNYGGGLRISLFTEDKFNLRIDYGFNRNRGSISIGAGEEF